MTASDVQGLPPARLTAVLEIIAAAPVRSRAVPRANEAAIVSSVSQLMALRAVEIDTHRRASIKPATIIPAKSTDIHSIVVTKTRPATRPTQTSARLCRGGLEPSMVLTR